ncbi:MAG: Gfo/Idh/MocA family oxidoreductase [Acidobacteriota bacterium]
MERRDFIKAGAAAAAVAASKPLFGWQGANNRVRMAVIGCGNRAGRVFDSLARHNDLQWVGACEVNDARLAGFMNASRETYKLDNVKDYRRILDRKDVDAVLIGTPDFSHARIMIDAVSAGKDVYVEKPASNNIARINGMLDAFNKSKQIVQVGTQQRSWDHFQDAKKILDSGVLGNVTQVIISQPGSYARSKEAAQPVPTTLDWNMWQLAGMEFGAPPRDFKPSRLGFRAWYEYGSGLIGDWGAHHVDVANWFMNADKKVPLKTAAVGSFLQTPDADPEMVPDSFSISWLYDTHTVTFANGVMARPAGSDIEGWGVFFISGRGSLQVNRMGYALRPSVPTTQRKQGAPPPPTAGNVNLGAGAAAPAAGAPPAGAPAGGPGGGRGGRGGGAPQGPAQAANAPILDYQLYINPRGGVEEDYPLDAHTRNFLDCIKSRQKPAATMEIGHNSALPCLLALESLKTGKMLGWDAAKRQAVVL